jgi:oligoendopeptidase F
MKPFSQFLDELNNEFLQLHTTKEDLFWQAKMGLADNVTEVQHRHTEAEIAFNRFAQDATKLAELRRYEGGDELSENERIALAGWKMFFEANVIEDPKAKQIAAHIVELEGEMQLKRGGMGLGYIHPVSGEKVAASTNELSNMLISETDEAMRKAAYEALLSIGPFILDNGFIEIIKERNKLARSQGYEDYYDYKVQRTEHMTKKELFALLDDLEVRTREANKRSVEAFAKEKGEQAIQPWNFKYYRGGDIEAKKDPYLPFADGLERWVHSFAAMGIRYRGAKLTLDLVDRKGKYENGFMHGPVPSWYKNGAWVPATINFTANAIPNRVGSGSEALNTLFHEGGHAAHFSNIQMNAPCYGQEFAPTSVAYAETQSMFLDSLLGDADWLARYAKNANGEAMPMEIIEQHHRDEQPFLAMMVRAMLGVCYAEKWFYEASEEQLTPANIQSMIADLEKRMYDLPASTRPILAVPHILAGESSAYYHGYVLAEMAVQQTRKYFFEKYGYITDNSAIGPELENGYWKWGYSVPFFELVKKLTGKPFNADALVAYATRTTEEAIAEAHRLYEDARKRAMPESATTLEAAITVIHGRERIASFSNGDFSKANEGFKQWVTSHFPKSSKAT